MFVRNCEISGHRIVTWLQQIEIIDPTSSNAFSETFNGYAFILETVCLEIIGSKTVDPNLKTVLESFLNSDCFMKWMQVSKNEVQMPQH